MKTLFDLHNHVQSLPNSIDDYFIKNGYEYEALWKIVFVTNSNPIFYSKNIVYCDGNIKRRNIKQIKNTNTHNYLVKTNINIGSKTGVTDIILEDINENKYILFSVKFFIEEGDLDDYDLSQIHSSIKTEYPNCKYELGLIVKSKKDFMDKYNKSRNSVVKKILNKDYIFDLDDLLKFYKNLNPIDTNKRHLKLHFHQEKIVNKTIIDINEGNKSFLWGCKPRSGKSYMIGGLIDKFYQKNKSCKVLIITPAPKETKSQFMEDLFEDYHNFHHFNKTDLNSSNYNNIDNTDEPMILITSKQFLQLKENKLPFDIDLLIFDEQHFGGTTDLSQGIIKKFKSSNTIFISMTATYYKPISLLQYDKVHYWSLEDETICKTIASNEYLNPNFETTFIDLITNRFGISEDLMYEINFFKEFKPYIKMPKLHILTNMFHQSSFDKIKSDIKMNEGVFGFCMDTLFSMKKDKLLYENQINYLFNYITGSNRQCMKDFKDGDQSIFRRILDINLDTNSRECNDMIWFLPITINSNINKLSIALKDIMNKHNVLQNYEILIINSLNKDIDEQDIKKYIVNKRNNALENGKKGIIILAGNQLTLGISLPFIDCIFLFNNTISIDKIYQMMFRCMTEDKDKKNGFVVDFQLNRVLQTCLNYNSNNLKLNDNLNTEKQLKYIITNHLIDIDRDMFKLKKLNETDIINKLLEIWKQDPQNEFQRCLKMIEQEIIEVDEYTQKQMNKFFNPNDKTNLNVVSTKLDSDDETQDLQTGIDRKENPDYSPSSSNSNGEEIVKEEINIQITKDILPFIVPFVSILLINKDIELNFRIMLEYISQNPHLMECFKSQCHIWWNNENLYDLIYKIVTKYIENNLTIHNACLTMKLNIQSFIDKPIELLQFINNCLKPKEKEKKQFGEVFTPMELVNEMLDKLPVEVWSDPNLKWFDPANGMGNFPIAIYTRLMISLKEVIPDDMLRKRHILENMLYMSELNKKNCYICNLIFNTTGEYKLNLYCGDSLKLDIQKEWNIDKFDIIVGNPPYNTGFNEAGSSPLYNKFIEYYLNKTYLLLFVIPSRWFSGGKGLDKFREMMINRNDIVFIKHYYDASKLFGNNIRLQGGINYFLIDKSYNGLCNYNNNFIKLNKYDILVDNKFYKIIDTLLDYINHYNLSNIYLGRYYNIEVNDKRLFNEELQNCIRCYVSKQKGFIKYIDKRYVNKDYNFYKVITARANGTSESTFGNIFIGDLISVHTGSYISFKTDSESKSKSLLSYLKCRMPNFMLYLRKTSQDISETTCKWIPLPPLDRIWNDELVYDYFKLDKDDIELIKSTKINGYKDL